MTQLFYNEAFDPYHAVFRFFRLHLACDFRTALPFEMLRILDFYLLFPFRLQSMRLASEDIAWRRVSKAYEVAAPYGSSPDQASIFERMEVFQRAAAESLVGSGIISRQAWETNEVQFEDGKVPEAIAMRCQELNSRMDDILNILNAIRIRYPLSGRDGLKDRSGLLEYRYDSL